MDEELYYLTATSLVYVYLGDYTIPPFVQPPFDFSVPLLGGFQYFM